MPPRIFHPWAVRLKSIRLMSDSVTGTVGELEGRGPGVDRAGRVPFTSMVLMSIRRAMSLSRASRWGSTVFSFA